MANGIIEKLINIFNIPIRVRSSSDGKAIYFADEKEENIHEDKDYYSMGALGPYTADRQHKLKLQYGNWRIFEVRDKDKFFSTMLTFILTMTAASVWVCLKIDGRKCMRLIFQPLN